MHTHAPVCIFLNGYTESCLYTQKMTSEGSLTSLQQYLEEVRVQEELNFVVHPFVLIKIFAICLYSSLREKKANWLNNSFLFSRDVVKSIYRALHRKGTLKMLLFFFFSIVAVEFFHWVTHSFIGKYMRCPAIVSQPGRY